MKVESGKFYRDGHGNTGGPAIYAPDYDGDKYDWIVPPLGCFKENGESMRDGEECDLIAEWTDKPRSWSELTDAEKGALLLAQHEGKAVQVWAYWQAIPSWRDTEISMDTDMGTDSYAYRIKPEPFVDTVTLYGSNVTWTPTQTDSDTRKLSIPIKDGLAITGTFTNENGDTIQVKKI